MAIYTPMFKPRSKPERVRIRKGTVVKSIIDRNGEHVQLDLANILNYKSSVKYPHSGAKQRAKELKRMERLKAQTQTQTDPDKQSD